MFHDSWWFMLKLLSSEVIEVLLISLRDKVCL